MHDPVLTFCFDTKDTVLQSYHGGTNMLPEPCHADECTAFVIQITL